MGDFLSEPRPDRIAQWRLAGEPGPNIKPALILSAGIKIITEDHQGLKLVPHKAVVLVIGEVGSNGESTNEREIDIPSSMAREFAASIVGYCDAIEATQK